MPDVRFSGLTVFSPDTAALADFYESALGFAREHADGEEIALRVPIAEGKGSIGLLVHPGDSKRLDLGSFSVADLDDSVAAMHARGASILSQPTDTPWGTREAAVADPAGNSFLVEETPAS